MGDRQRDRLETGQGVKFWGKGTCGENRMKMNVIDESQTSSEQTQVVNVRLWRSGQTSRPQKMTAVESMNG
jgi:hypothetical protein